METIKPGKQPIFENNYTNWYHGRVVDCPDCEGKFRVLPGDNIQVVATSLKGQPIGILVTCPTEGCPGEMIINKDDKVYGTS